MGLRTAGQARVIVLKNAAEREGVTMVKYVHPMGKDYYMRAEQVWPESKSGKLVLSGHPYTPL